MATVSTYDFYFSKFGGYIGLQECLLEDLVEIPNLADGELTQPGTYTGVSVLELQSHGRDTYTVDFGYPNGTYIHRQTGNRNSRWFSKLLPHVDSIFLLKLDIVLGPTSKHVAGKLLDKYYLIHVESNRVVSTFPTAKALSEYCRKENINIQGIGIYDIRITDTGIASAATETGTP